MTESQKIVSKKAFELLGEHFESFVLVVQFSEEDDDLNQQASVMHEGGYFNALGLMAKASHDMKHWRPETDENTNAQLE